MPDSLNIGGEPNPDQAKAQSEHDAAMAAKAAEGVTSITSSNSQTGEDISMAPGQEPGNKEGDKPQRPDDIPEKFWDADKGEVNVAALLKAQQDAEAALRKQSSNESQKDDAQGGEGDKADKGTGGESGLSNPVEAAQAEFAEKGELTTETYSALEKAGMPREMVDNYIAGQQALVGSIENAAFSAFDGTRESYTRATEWAAANLEPSEIQALNVQLTSTNPAIVKAGAEALAQKYTANADIDPSVNISGQSNNTVTGGHFKSSHELTQAMADPRYAKDPAYRAEVQQKIERASRAGIDLFG
ncbi:capsid assembly protein [Microbulbifer sp. 2201CG32-9]|uniref:capsid assembly protein n=1 Tax=Microbulbifer sp. 2201CG32-9 TaxID=3232309 RepID=UPI00345BEC4D